jgi:soluble methane monooxygenase-binding protein MmoD
MTALNDFIIEDAIAEGDLATNTEMDVDGLDAAYEPGERDTQPTGDHVFLKSAGQYTAYAVDLDYLWRWEIYLEGGDLLVQEGASISLTSATEAVDHVLAYFAVRDSAINRAAGAAGRP